MRTSITFLTALTLLVSTMLNAQTVKNHTTKGPTAQAFSYFEGPLGDDVHIEFDVDNFTGTLAKKSDFNTKLYAGEYYMGTWYANDDDYTLYAIDPETGEYTSISTTGWVTEMAYDYSTNTMFGVKDNTLYTINLASGDYDKFGTFKGLGDTEILSFTIDLEGNMYGISSGDGKFYTIDRTSLQCTSVNYTGLESVLIHSMGFDHATGILYWAQCGGFDGNHLCTIDIETGVATILADNTGVMTGFFIPYLPNTNLPHAPTNVEVTPIGASLQAELSWTNPTTTLGGDPLTGITKMVISRDGEVIKEFDNPDVGEAMTYTDKDIPSSGHHYYTFYAVNEEGEGKTASVKTIIGDFCPVFLELFSTTNLSWEGSNITVTSKGELYGQVTLEYGDNYKMFTIYVPSGELEFTYNLVGPYNEEKSFKIYNADMEMIYYEPISPTGPEDGLFLTYLNDCGYGVSVEQTELDLSKVYPNPVSNVLYFDMEDVIGNVTIYDISGKMVKSVALVNNSIDVSELSNGLYFISFQTENRNRTVKIIKQ